MSKPDSVTGTSTLSGTELVVFEREQERCRAVSDGDLAALQDILDDDLTHTHITGLTQDKAAYLAGLSGRPRLVSRSDMRVQVFGEVAVMRGLLANTFPDAAEDRPVRQLQVLQVWVRRLGTWRQLAFACAGPVGAPKEPRT